MKKLFLKRMLFIPLGIIAVAATWYAQGHPDWTEQAFSSTAYPVLSTAVGFLPSLVDFSVAEWLSGAFLLFCLAYAAYYVRKAVIDKDERGMTIYRGTMGAIAIACTVYFAFTFLCGLNYYRCTFSSYTGYDVEQVGADPAQRQEELAQLCSSLADDLGQERVLLGEDADLFAAQPGEFEAYAHKAVAAVQGLAQEYPVLQRPLYSPPKPVALSGLMSDAGIGGMFFPFTMESNVNAIEPFFTTPANMAHELAHQCGFMREDEANFIAYLACVRTDDALMRYSGLLLAYDHSIAALSKTDPERAAEVRAGLPAAVQRDLAERTQFWDEYEGAILEASQSMNDAYLKANSQTDGLRSYGRMVDLLLAEQRAAEEAEE